MDNFDAYFRDGKGRVIYDSEAWDKFFDSVREAIRRAMSEKSAIVLDSLRSVLVILRGIIARKLEELDRLLEEINMALEELGFLSKAEKLIIEMRLETIEDINEFLDKTTREFIKMIKDEKGDQDED